jgi:hypothetical protein
MRQSKIPGGPSIALFAKGGAFAMLSHGRRCIPHAAKIIFANLKQEPPIKNKMAERDSERLRRLNSHIHINLLNRRTAKFTNITPSGRVGHAKGTRSQEYGDRKSASPVTAFQASPQLLCISSELPTIHQ